MNPTKTGQLYDKIASWWKEQVSKSNYGLKYVSKAIEYSKRAGYALDVGCGSDGRILNELVNAGFQATGLDVSKSMIEIARKENPEVQFIVGDICEWQPSKTFDIIIAWDSIFHVPYEMQSRVAEKLCTSLSEDGIFLFTAGGIDGEKYGEMQGCEEMQGQEFYYSSLDVIEYFRIMRNSNCECLYFTHDQYPAKHVVFICKRANKSLHPTKKLALFGG